MRKLASIQRVREIRTHTNADALEIAIVNGWQCVVKKGEVSVNDLVVYFEVDSVLPVEPIYEFLRKCCYIKRDWIEGFRLNTIKLRGELSQGLILPLESVFPTSTGFAQEGFDVTDILKVQKWDPPIPANLAGQIKGQFPSFIVKSDQERVQNLVDKVFSNEYLDMPVELTMKLDGSSCTVFYKDGEVGVCSRNLQLKINKENENNSFIRAAIDSNLIEALKKYGKNIAIQAELMGPGIQGNRENLKNVDLYVYNIFDIDSFKFVDPASRNMIYNQLETTVKHVPVISDNITLRQLKLDTLNNMLEWVSNLKSMNNDVAEGVVFKFANGFQFKCISNKYLLSEK